MGDDTYISWASTGYVTKLKPRPTERSCVAVLGRTEDGGYIRCGQRFLGRSNARVCPDCAAERKRARAAEARARQVAKRAARRAAAREHLHCATCGNRIWADRNRPAAAYCSPACRQKAYRQRQAARAPTCAPADRVGQPSG